MSADLLREAAAKMRERAEAAVQGPWWTNESVGSIFNAADAEHIASWHPAVALAVADWLEYVAQTWRIRPVAERGAVHGGDQEQALGVARAYLGGES